MDIHHLQNTIESAWDERENINPSTVSHDLKLAVEQTLYHLEQGTLRVSEQIKEGEWQCHQWIKKAVLLYFKIQPNVVYNNNVTQFYDKVPLRFSEFQPHEFEEMRARIVPGAYVRKGSFIGPNAVLMPSYVNIGAYVGEGSMIDTWATVGSCAQIGANVHISGGAGIGGVLEPLQANPTIIEDNCFIGARSEVVEGVIVEKGAVISMGVYIGQSTKIYDRENDKIIFGRVPSGAVVVPGTLPSSDGKCQLYCAVIVKRVDEKTKSKVEINNILREA